MKNRIVGGILLTLCIYFSPIFSQDSFEPEEHDFVFMYENYDEDCSSENFDLLKVDQACIVCSTEELTPAEFLALDQTTSENTNIILHIGDDHEHTAVCQEGMEEQTAIIELFENNEHNEVVIELPSHLIDSQDVEIDQLPDVIEVSFVPSYELLEEGDVQSDQVTMIAKAIVDSPVVGIQEACERCELCLKSEKIIDEDIVVTDDEITLVPHELINSVKKAAKKKKKLEEKLRKEKLKLFKKSKKCS